MITRDRISAVPVSSPKGFSPRLCTEQKKKKRRGFDMNVLMTEKILHIF